MGKPRRRQVGKLPAFLLPGIGQLCLAVGDGKPVDADREVAFAVDSRRSHGWCGRVSALPRGLELARR